MPRMDDVESHEPTANERYLKSWRTIANRQDGPGAVQVGRNELCKLFDVFDEEMSALLLALRSVVGDGPYRDGETGDCLSCDHPVKYPDHDPNCAWAVARALLDRWLGE